MWHQKTCLPYVIVVGILFAYAIHSHTKNDNNDITQHNIEIQNKKNLIPKIDRYHVWCVWRTKIQMGKKHSTFTSFFFSFDKLCFVRFCKKW